MNTTLLARAIDRALLAVHGQPDSMDTPPKRAFWPATVDANGIPTPACTGAGCNQGRAPEHCDCVLDRDDTEFRWKPAP